MHTLCPHTDFPELFTVVHWGEVSAVFELAASMPPAQLIANVNCVPFVGDHAVLVRLAGGQPELPGGTLEPGENVRTALSRELREEAGARLLSFTLIGFWRCHSRAGAPYRSHLPHPDFIRIVGYGDVDIVSAPLNPTGGEQVDAVDVLSVAQVANVFRRWNRPDLAALYQLASILRRDSGTRQNKA